MPCKNYIVIILVLLNGVMKANVSDSTRKTVYLLPGQGADGRLFQRLSLENCDTVVIKYPVPLKGETLPAYAMRLSAQIDTTKPFYLVGVSFGGMNAIEIGKILHPEKIILISSAKTKNELPLRYRFQKTIPLYALTGGRMLKYMANFARPIVEPDSKPDTKTFRSMIDDKDPAFMKRSIRMIIQWNNSEIPANVVHIHGDNDHTLPYRKINNAIKVENGSHMMTLIKAEEISKLVNQELKVSGF